jgi:hypothetical protein
LLLARRAASLGNEIGHLGQLGALLDYPAHRMPIIGQTALLAAYV